MQATATGTIVTFGGGKFAYDLGAGCTGLSVAMALAAVIVAFPASAKARFWGVLIGVPFTFLVNITCLISMAGWASSRRRRSTPCT
jgi:exosortase/archaeosortase family protein